MPVTKKKGAIFAIYSDSPSHNSINAISTARQTNSKITSPTKRSLPSSSSSSPVKSRRALTALEPVSIKPKSNERMAKGKAGLDEPMKSKSDPAAHAGKGVLRAKSTKRTTTTTTTTTSIPSITTAPLLTSTSTSTKRQLDAGPPSPTRLLAPNSLRPDATTPTRMAHHISPAKRTRPSPRDGAKENIPPGTGEGSPATRTRSKTRTGLRTHHAQMSISSLGALGLGSPPSRSGGRMTGRAITVFMDESPLLPLPKATTTAKGRMNVLGPRVRPDGVLVDVSEAYGAEGPEPEGFRTAGMDRPIST